MKEHYLKVNYATRGQNRQYDRQLLQHLLSHDPTLRASGRVLDVACGTGGYRSTFEGLGFEYAGIDIDNDDPSNHIQRVDVGRARFPFEDAHFDVVFFKMGIEHLTLHEISHCLSEIRRVLKPRGAVIVLTPDWNWMYDVFYDEYTHQTPFTPKSMRTALEMNGLRCVVSKSLIQLPEVWSEPRLELLCNAARWLYPVLKSRKFVRYSKERIVFGLATRD